MALPDPPPGKTGWPWTDDISQPHERDSLEMPLPRLTIVTPSYNQGEFLEETIRSVLLQGYPNLEYFVIDGGSSDNSLQILEKYQPWLTYWSSAKDGGQADALNKGLSRGSGSLAGWINSDDLLLPGALWVIAARHSQRPEAILVADVVNVDEREMQSWRISQHNVSFEAFREHWRYPVTWHQPGIFFPLALYRSAGPFDISLSNLFDWDFMCRVLQIAPVDYMSRAVAQFRYHPRSKSATNTYGWIKEKQIVTERFWPEEVARDASLARAVLCLVAADTRLALHGRDAEDGMTLLWQSAAMDCRVLRWWRYWLLWLKALLPIRLLYVLRRLRKAF